MQGRPPFSNDGKSSVANVHFITSLSFFAATWLAESRSVVGPQQKGLCSHHRACNCRRTRPRGCVMTELSVGMQCVCSQERR
jgi:hypothetical protein